MYKALFTGAVLAVLGFGLSSISAQSKLAVVASIQAPDQFSAIHDSLDRTANSLLADAVQRMADAAMTIVIVWSLILLSRWSATSIRIIVQMCLTASLQRWGAWISCAHC